jgi:predicted SprT family Zn-dependent metalloprotease
MAASIPFTISIPGATVSLVTGRASEPAGVRELAESLLAQHGLSNWTIAFDQSRTRAGICNRQRREIGLSTPLMSLWTEAQCRDTILHEIAHALTTGGHTEEWKRTCLRIGAKPERCWDEGNESIPPRWTGTCPNGHVMTRHKLTHALRRNSCPECSNRYDPRFLFTWKESA